MRFPLRQQGRAGSTPTYVPVAIASAGSATSLVGRRRVDHNPDSSPPGLLGDKTFRKGSPSSAGSASPSTPGSTIPRSVNLPISHASFPKRNRPQPRRRARRNRCLRGKHNEVSPAGPHRSRRSRPPECLCQNRRSWYGQRFRLPRAVRPPSSEVLAATWRPYIESCINAFGARDACLRATFPSTKVRTAIRCSGTHASF